jgi:hypothetical protein
MLYFSTEKPIKKERDMKRMIFLVAILTAGCQGMTLTDEEEATLLLTITTESVDSKSSGREMPDTNSMTLIIRSESDTLFQNLYGSKPRELKLEPGKYFVELFSHRHLAPLFNTPCWGDSREITLSSGEVSSLDLNCRQTNSGVRLVFSPEFITKYSAYQPEVYSGAGAADYPGTGAAIYPYTEERYLYLNPGRFYVRLKPEGETSAPIPLFSKTAEAREMLSINIKLAPGDTGAIGDGIIIDTSSTWIIDTVIIDGNDGSSQAKAILLSRLSEFEGMKVWVKGYIVGGDISSDTIRFIPPFVKPSHMAIAADPSERVREMCFGVNLPSGSIQDQFSLVAFPENVGKRAWVKGTIVPSYLGGQGINPVTEVIVE